MIQNVYTIYDKVAEEYGPPFIAVNHQVAERNLRNLFFREKVQDASDYQLWHIAYWDGIECVLEPLREPERVLEERLEGVVNLKIARD